jgi:hypothetical protein
MDRGDKHAPRVDEQLEHEVAALTHGQAHDEGRTEGRTLEATADDGAGTGVRPELDDAPGAGLGEADLTARSELAKHLPPSVFPAHHVELMVAARQSFAPAPVLAQIESLPADRMYDTLGDVWRSLGGATEGREPRG